MQKRSMKDTFKCIMTKIALIGAYCSNSELSLKKFETHDHRANKALLSAEESGEEEKKKREGGEEKEDKKRSFVLNGIEHHFPFLAHRAGTVREKRTIIQQMVLPTPIRVEWCACAFVLLPLFR